MLRSDRVAVGSGRRRCCKSIASASRRNYWKSRFQVLHLLIEMLSDIGRFVLENLAEIVQLIIL